MSSSGDGDRIAQALAAGVEEAVEINQRGLVEKVRNRDLACPQEALTYCRKQILARYSVSRSGLQYRRTTDV